VLSKLTIQTNKTKNAHQIWKIKNQALTNTTLSVPWASSHRTALVPSIHTKRTLTIFYINLYLGRKNKPKIKSNQTKTKEINKKH
jgi:hypothetical protein